MHRLEQVQISCTVKDYYCEKADKCYDANSNRLELKIELPDDFSQEQNKHSSMECAPKTDDVATSVARSHSHSDSGIHHPMEWFKERCAALTKDFTRDLYSSNFNSFNGISDPGTAKPVEHKSELATAPVNLDGFYPGTFRSKFGSHPPQKSQESLSHCDTVFPLAVSTRENVDKSKFKDSVSSTGSAASADSLPSKYNGPFADFAVPAVPALSEDSAKSYSVPSRKRVPAENSSAVASPKKRKSAESSVPRNSPSVSAVVSPKKRKSAENSVPRNPHSVSAVVSPQERKSAENSVPRNSLSVSVDENQLSRVLPSKECLSSTTVPSTCPVPRASVPTTSVPQTSFVSSTPSAHSQLPVPSLTSLDKSSAGRLEATEVSAAVPTSAAQEVAQDHGTLKKNVELANTCQRCGTVPPCLCEIRARLKNRGKRSSGVNPLRRCYTSEQVAVLEEAFKGGYYVSREKKEKLATTLELPMDSVKVWFQNRRMREKLIRRRALNPAFPYPVSHGLSFRGHGCFPYPSTPAFPPILYPSPSYFHHHYPTPAAAAPTIPTPSQNYHLPISAVFHTTPTPTPAHHRYPTSTSPTPSHNHHHHLPTSVATPTPSHDHPISATPTHNHRQQTASVATTPSLAHHHHHLISSLTPTPPPTPTPSPDPTPPPTPTPTLHHHQLSAPTPTPTPSPSPTPTPTHHHHHHPTSARAPTPTPYHHHRPQQNTSAATTPTPSPHSHPVRSLPLPSTHHPPPYLHPVPPPVDHPAFEALAANMDKLTSRCKVTSQKAADAINARAWEILAAGDTSLAESVLGSFWAQAALSSGSPGLDLNVEARSLWRFFQLVGAWTPSERVREFLALDDRRNVPCACSNLPGVHSLITHLEIMVDYLWATNKRNRSV